MVRKLWTNRSANFPDTPGLPFDNIEAQWKEYLEREAEGGVQVDMGPIDESGFGKPGLTTEEAHDGEPLFPQRIGRIPQGS